jgi:hypothetical protein
MYNYTDEIRQDRTKCYFFFTMEELMEYFEEIKKKRHKPQDDEY